jgi:hypothetical protein
MKTERLNSDVIELMQERDELVARLNEVERQLSDKHRLLIKQRTVETAAHDVRRFERRMLCAQ